VGVEVDLYSFLTSALCGVADQRHASAALPPGKRRGVHCIGGCAGPRAHLDKCEGEEVSCPIEIRTSKPPGTSESIWIVIS
jgi:hypothetical protein